LVERGDLERAGPWIYRAATARLEAELAELIQALLDTRPARRLSDPAPELDGGAGGGAEQVTLSPEQWAGVRAAFTERLSLITGGPGTGKTASIRTIGSLAVLAGLRVLLVAPTGRAAVRMTEATEMSASTVHSALGWIPGEGPTHDED